MYEIGKMIESIIDEVIEREGGFVNNLLDKGGATKYGITLKTLSGWMHEEATIDDVRNLTKAIAATIYQELYIDKPKINLIQDDKLKALLFDCGVNSGTETAIKLLQQCIGAKPDGILGAVTLGIIKAFNPQELRERFLNTRLAYLNNIIARHPEQIAFESGWKYRIESLRKEYV